MTSNSSPFQELFSILAEGKEVILEFPSLTEVKAAHSHLYMIKQRSEAMNSKFGFSAGTEHLTLRRSLISDSTQTQDSSQDLVRVKFWLGEKETKPAPFKLISIIEKPEGSTNSLEQEELNATLPTNLGED